MIVYRCGHVKYSDVYVQGKEVLVCPVCRFVGNPKASEIIPEEELPNLIKERQSRCPDCGDVVPSDFDLEFFKYCPDMKYDRHYDGCRGWS